MLLDDCDNGGGKGYSSDRKVTSSHSRPPTMTTWSVRLSPSTAAAARVVAYLRCRCPTASACRTPRTCSSADGCRRCTWYRPTTVHPVLPCRRCRGAVSSSSASPAATPEVDSVRAAAGSGAPGSSSATADRYKCLGRIPRWSRPTVLQEYSRLLESRRRDFLLLFLFFFIRDKTIGNETRNTSCVRPLIHLIGEPVALNLQLVDLAFQLLLQLLKKTGSDTDPESVETCLRYLSDSSSTS